MAKALQGKHVDQLTIVQIQFNDEKLAQRGLDELEVGTSLQMKA